MNRWLALALLTIAALIAASIALAGPAALWIIGGIVLGVSTVLIAAVIWLNWGCE